MANIAELLAKNLGKILEERGITQKAFGTQSGIDPTDIGKYLKARIAVGSKTLEKMAAALGVHPADLIRDPVETRQPSPVAASPSEPTMAEMMARLIQVEAVLSAMSRQGAPAEGRQPAEPTSAKEQLVEAILAMSEANARTVLQMLPPNLMPKTKRDAG